MEQFIDWYCSEPRLALNRTVVLRFRLHLELLGLAAGTINQRLAAVRRLAYEAADSGLLSPELAAGIRRVNGVKQLGCRAGNWLNQDQARLLLEKANGQSLRHVRDVAQRLAAVRRLAYEAADSGLLSPELAAGIRRVKGVKQLGCRAGNWLNQDQARLLLEKANGQSLRHVRDVAMIAIMLGCGLRRAELSALAEKTYRFDRAIGRSLT